MIVAGSRHASVKIIITHWMSYALGRWREGIDDYGFLALPRELESQSRECAVVGIELKATLKTRKLLILLNEKNAKNTGFAK